jgi:CheY-like chemotaxis protein/two-component sensor histidine kinase
MSHEMRTPLNVVIGLSELTIEVDGLSKDVRENLEKINSAGTTLLSTVNDILDISKIEAGKFELVPVEYDIPSLINDSITQSIMSIEDKPIQFVLDFDENIPTNLYGDDLRVKQILNNLLTNAFKYTREGTVKLSISCEYENSPHPKKEENGTIWLVARVSDTGKGIRKEDIDRLFIDYIQVDTLSNRKIEGTGLGLSITKRIVEMMDGAIFVESEYGKGSVFTVRFRQNFISGETIGAEVVKNLKNFQYSNSKRKKNSQMIRIRLPYARVLVVDDVVTNLDVVKGMMKPYGMQIDCVGSGYEAVEAIRIGKVKYNAVFMDHMMPGMNGMEATKIIREEIGTEYAKNLPIIALTANAIVGNREMFLSNGFHDFLSKPIEIAR